MINTNKEKKNKNNQKKKPENRSVFTNVFFYIFLVFILLAMANAAFKSNANARNVALSEVLNNIKNKEAQDVVVSGDSIEVLLRDGTSKVAVKESNISFDDILENNGLDTSMLSGEYKIEHRLSLDQILTPILTFGFPVILLLLIFRQMRNASGDIFSFGKSRARLFAKGSGKVTFNDVAGIEEAKRELLEIVDFLKNPGKYRKLGARIPKGVLLVGPSGVGKTLLARAIAGEAGVPFFSAAGSEFMEMLVGVGSSRVRDLFKMAREGQPSLIFIDEIDAIGRQRGMGIGGGHDEREQTLNQILVEMDGFDARTDVIVLAATNRPDMLDPALVRPGRFDRRVTIPLPDLKDREQIIKIHMRGKPFESDVQIERIAKKTVGFSGADLENMLNESAILAARANKLAISQVDVDEASLKVTMGSERRMLQTEEERKLIAYHEAGHALVSAFVPEMDAVSRVSIVARGGSLGHTSFPPERDRYNETKTRLLSMISTMLGGRSAEEVVNNEVSIGASDDINKASQIARQMVTQYGMSDLGPIAYASGGGMGWLARDMEEGYQYSQEIASKIDEQVHKIIENCHNQAREILTKHRDTLDRVANALLEKETIYEDEFRRLVQGQEAVVVPAVA
jgi:cell division protease FtsH